MSTNNYTKNDLVQITKITAEGVYAQSAGKKKEREDRLIFTFSDKQKTTNVPRCDEIIFSRGGIKIVWDNRAFETFSAAE